MSNDRPKGSYSGPLSLQWCAYSMTVRAMPMNYLAADLSRIDAALWGRESEIGAAIAEAPAMVEALRRILQWINAGCDPSRKSLENARAILSRIDGAGDTLPDAPVPAPTADAPSMGDLLEFVQTAARGNTDADDLQEMAQRLLAVVRGEN